MQKKMGWWLGLVAAALALAGCTKKNKEPEHLINIPVDTPAAQAPLAGLPSASTSAPSATPTANAEVFHIAARLPKGVLISDFGRNLSMVLDAHGDALLAFTWRDPDRDGDPKDTGVYFIGYDAQVKAFKSPVRVAMVGDVPAEGASRQLSLARDDSTGELGIAYTGFSEDGTHRKIGLATSSDQGVTWKNAAITTDEENGGNAIAPALAMAKGQVFLAYVADAVYFRRGTSGNLSAAGALPTPHDTTFDRKADPVVTVDAEGQPGVAWGVTNDPGGVAVAFYRPGWGAKSSVIAFDTGRTANETWDLRLAFAGTHPRLVVAAETAEGKGLFSVRSDDDGATWGKAVRIPSDGHQSLGGHVALAVGASGEAAAAAELGGGNPMGVRCGQPKLSRSADFASWATCSPTGSKDPEVSATFTNLGFSGDKLVVAFRNGQDMALPPGLYVWREH